MTNSTITMAMKGKLKQKTLSGLTIAMAIFMTACGNETALPSVAEPIVSVNAAAAQIQVKLGVNHNYLTKDCPNQAKSCYQATMTLRLPQSMPKNWRILFSNLSPISKATSNEFNLVHVNGDLHEISPKTDKIAANTDYQIVFYGHTPLVSESVLFPNYLLVDSHGETSVITSTTEKLIKGHQLPRPQHVEAFSRPEQQLRNADDKVVIADTSERFYRFSSRITDSTETHNLRIIPKLQSADWSSETVHIPSGIQLPDMPDAKDKSLLAAVTQRLIANSIQISQQGLPIKIIQKSETAPESYSLFISAEDIQIEYADSAGLYYAMMSIAQLYDAPNQALPLGLAKDQPSMAFRGLHIDVSRNFRSKDFILQTLEQMSYYKLNKLHLHLADDEGWRLQIDSLPELTDVGAFRCFDESEQNCLLPQLAGGNGKFAATEQNSGFYSIDDYIEILQYADARQIEVLPSLDMPGHSRAAIVAMNARYQRLMKLEKPDEAAQYFLTEIDDKSEYRSIQHYNDNTLNPCLPATYTFIGEVLEQLIDMHKTAGVPLKRYHIGADETAGAWAESPACAALIASNDSLNEAKQLGSYFVEKVANNISELGVLPAAWSDGLSHANSENLPEKLQSNSWETLYSGGHSKVHEMINKGWQVVLSTPDVLYFDFPYEADPIEPGYYWGSRYTDSYQVFQFMPHNLAVHAEIWRDKLGNDYAAPANIDIQNDQQILGIQAQLWGETVRSNAKANYMLYPRLLVVAERAWHTPKWAESYKKGVAYSASTKHFDAAQRNAMNADWFSFSDVLSHKAMPQLVKEWVEPRVPLPGAVIKEGVLHMHSAYSGLLLEYKIQDGDWQQYNAPIKPTIQGDIWVRAKIPTTQVTSREMQLSKS
ncbi:family 20 glycosylhydrolase [uncultured Paraglaciecola sp.]|uniref:family 20 glycosylhydrolase n=1 Tax=uncultured Paraglaciecola sp. TaxID=1765024 RepID=UPI0030D7A26A|tara:strand:+ start:355740 stop:358379 length:2640 start_codon:yes stop_codon:yes gene_type:complete